MPENTNITMSDIAVLAGGVTVPAVANWRKRYDDFPPAVDKQGRTPLFNKDAVVEWLTTNNKLGAPTDQLQAVMWALADMMRNTFNSSAEFLSLVVEPDAPHENIPPATREKFTRDYNSLVEEHGERAVFDTFLQIVSRAAGRTHAEHDTHPELLRLLTALSDTPEHATIYDPCVGMGSALEAIASPTSTLYGQDINQNAVKVAAKRFTLHGHNNTVTAGDSIATDNFPDVVADRIFTAPPLALQLQERQIDRHDPRWTVEIPSARQSDSAFIQIVLAHMNEHGKAIVHLSNSTLFTRNDIREYLVRNNLLDAVISLPSGAIANTNITSCLLVLDRTRPLSTPTRQTPTLFIGQLEDHPKGLATSYVDELIDIWNNWHHSEHTHPNTVAATLSQIAENEFDLSPHRYVASASFDWPKPTAESDLQTVGNTIAEVVNSLTIDNLETPPVIASSENKPLSWFAVEMIRGNAPPKNRGTGNIINPADIANQPPIWDLLYPETNEESDSKFASTGDLLVAMRGFGTDRKVVGRVTPEWNGHEVSRDIMILRPRKLGARTIDSSYLYFWLMTPAFENFFKAHAKGITVLGIGRKDLLNFELPSINTTDQDDFIRYLRDTMRTQHQLRHATEQLEALTANREQLIMELAALNLTKDNK